MTQCNLIQPGTGADTCPENRREYILEALRRYSRPQSFPISPPLSNPTALNEAALSRERPFITIWS